MRSHRTPCLTALFCLLGSVGAQDAGTPKKPFLDPRAAGPAAQIWAPTTGAGQEVWFRRKITFPKPVKNVRIVASCDDLFTVAVDGKVLADSGMWEELVVVDLGDLGAGDHVVAVQAKNRGGPAALALWMTWTDATGQNRELVSDKAFFVTEEAEEKWMTVAFDDSGWVAAREQGRTPYGRTVYGMAPGHLKIRNAFAAATRGIEDGLEALRRAKGKAAVLRALTEIERAVMQARRAIHGPKKK